MENRSNQQVRQMQEKKEAILLKMMSLMKSCRRMTKMNKGLTNNRL